jgi:hypothetical protein
MKFLLCIVNKVLIAVYLLLGMPSLANSIYYISERSCKRMAKPVSHTF